MGSLTQADRIWNRACGYADFDAPDRVGDVALRALIRAHSDLMNGGMDAMVDRVSRLEIEAAADGFDYFGRADLASIMREAVTQGDNEARLHELWLQYNAAIPSGDSDLQAMFERRLTEAPGEFAWPPDQQEPV